MKAQMIYLGVEQRKNKKTDKMYYLAGFATMNGKAGQFYVNGENEDLKQELSVLKAGMICDCDLELTAFNGNFGLDLVGVKKK